MKRNILNKGSIGILSLILAVSLVACSQGTAQITLEDTESAVVTEAIPVITADQPATEISVSPSTVILATSPESDQGIVTTVQTTLDSLAQESGLAVKTTENLTPESLTADIKAVVGIGPGLDIAGWSAQFPGIQFVAIGVPGVAGSDNLSVIGDPAIDSERITFMAGYLAALISADYKTGGLFPSNIDRSNEMINSFVVGVRFFCGICQPKYPPYNSFPQWQTLPVENAANGFQTTVDVLVNSGVEILYIQGELLSPEILDYLSGVNIKIISDGHPESISDNWAGTLQLDPAPGLKNIWSNVVDGTGGRQEPASIVLTDLDAGLVSEGRYQMFEEMLSDLDAGIISVEPTP